MKKPVTIMLEESDILKLQKKQRSLMAKTGKTVSFSRIVQVTLKEALK